MSGIWPPDVGGPASHGPAIGAFLAERGHDVVAFASVSAQPVLPPFELHTTRRTRPLPVRWLDGTTKLIRLTRGASVVYATGLYHRSAMACRANDVPLVLKLVNDPAFERARSAGWFGGTLEAFQTPGGDRRIVALKRLRDAALAQAAHVITPSRYLARFVESWDTGAPVTVVPNPGPSPQPARDRRQLRAALGFRGPTVTFIGRLVAQKNLPLLLAAAAALPEVTFRIVGDGPERPSVEAEIDRRRLAGRVTVFGALAREQALRWMAASDVLVLPSSWENHPHVVVESLTMGTPVVATSTGGVPEIIDDGVNGLLTAPGDAHGLAEALRRALFDPETRATLQAGAGATGDRFAPDRTFGQAAEIIAEVAR